MEKENEALIYLSYGKVDNEDNIDAVGKVDKIEYSKYIYVVQVYNPNPDPLDLYLKQHGEETTTYSWGLAIDVWKSFWKEYTLKKITIGYDHSKVVLKGDFSEKLLEVLSCIKVKSDAIVAVYLIEKEREKEVLNRILNYSEEKPYVLPKQKHRKTYAGIAPTWQLSTCVEVDAKDILYQSDLDKYYPESATDINQKDALEKHKEELETSYFYQLCYPRKKNPETGQVDNKCNEYESNPIHLIEGGFLGNNPDGLASLDRDDDCVANVNNEEEWYDNVANYAVQYNMKFIFSNSAQHSINIKVYLISNASSHCAGIEFGGKAVGKFLQPNRKEVEDKISNPNRWYLFEGTIPPTKTEADKKVLEFRYMHLSKGSAPCMLQLQAKKV